MAAKRKSNVQKKRDLKPVASKKGRSSKKELAPKSASLGGRRNTTVGSTSTRGRGSRLPSGMMRDASIAASMVAHDPVAMSLTLVFGTVSTALYVGMTLTLDALRPAAAAFGDRLGKLVAPSATNANEAGLVVRQRIEENPNARRAALEGARALMDSLAEDAALPLANLTAEYINGGTAVDGFFRGTTRLLGDLTNEELATLRTMLRAALAGDIVQGEDSASLIYRPRVEGRQRGGPNVLKYPRRLSADDPRRPTTQSEWAILETPEALDDRCVLRIIQQLKLTGLADLPRTGGFGASMGPESLVIDAGTLRRLTALVG